MCDVCVAKAELINTVVTLGDRYLVVGDQYGRDSFQARCPWKNGCFLSSRNFCGGWDSSRKTAP